MRPLEGMLIVTLEHAIAAPYCTRQLADLGARVIKIDKAERRIGLSIKAANYTAEQLEAELPQMLAEHQTIVAALNRLSEAAARAGRSEIVAFAEALVEHARTEEEVMYPAAVLVGQVVRRRPGQRASAAAA